LVSPHSICEHEHLAIKYFKQEKIDLKQITMTYMKQIKELSVPKQSLHIFELKYLGTRK